MSGLVNKFGCRPVCFAGALVAATGFLIGSFSSSLEILLLTYGVMGGKFSSGLCHMLTYWPACFQHVASVHDLPEICCIWENVSLL